MIGEPTSGHREFSGEYGSNQTTRGPQVLVFVTRVPFWVPIFDPHPGEYGLLSRLKKFQRDSASWRLRHSAATNDVPFIDLARALIHAGVRVEAALTLWPSCLLLGMVSPLSRDSSLLEESTPINMKGLLIWGPCYLVSWELQWWQDAFFKPGK